MHVSYESYARMFLCSYDSYVLMSLMFLMLLWFLSLVLVLVCSYAPIKLIDSSMHIEIKNTKILKNIYIYTNLQSQIIHRLRSCNFLLQALQFVFRFVSFGISTYFSLWATRSEGLSTSGRMPRTLLINWPMSYLLARLRLRRPLGPNLPKRVSPTSAMMSSRYKNIRIQKRM